jgi:hypothetical protein
MALKVNTRKSYASMHRTFMQFCTQHSIDAWAPLSEEQLCLAMIAYVQTHKVTSLPTYLSALANWAQEHELGPLPRGRRFERVKKGIGNVFGLSESSQSKAALTLSDLAAIHSSLQPRDFDDTRDWCAYVFAFFGLLRLSEFIGAQLRFEYIERRDWGVRITVPFSKTNLQPVQVGLVRRDDLFCPVRAYDAYVALIPRPLRLPNLAFFRAAAGRSTPLSRQQFVDALKRRVQSVLHKNADEFAGHSFRRGGTTALFLAGVPETIIAVHGRWRSLAYRRYFDWGASRQLLPTHQLLEHTRGEFASK